MYNIGLIGITFDSLKEFYCGGLDSARPDIRQHSVYHKKAGTLVPAIIPYSLNLII